MKKSVKVLVILGSILICIGLIVVISVGFANGWSFATIKWENEVYESQRNTKITDIVLEFSGDALTIEPYDGETVQVVYPKSDLITTEFKLVDEKLKITSTVNWYVGFMWFNRIPTTKVYIPEKLTLNYNIEVNAGALTIDEGLKYGNFKLQLNAGAINAKDITCSEFNIDMNAGAVSIDKLACVKFTANISAGAFETKSLKSDTIKFNLSAGSANVKIADKKSDYVIKTHVSAGSCNITDQSAISYKTLVVDVSAGSVNVFFDE